MKELENLLTSLVERGWKPFNYIWTAERIEVEDDFEISIIFITWEFAYHTLRDLVVLESWLWQFVCENSLIKQCKGTICKNPKTYWNAWSIQWEWWYWCDIAEYRLLESSLIPEEELGQLLIDNIVVEWKKE